MPMESRDAAHQFCQRFMQVYDRFHRRARPSSYRPSPETLALLRHLSRTGPLTVTEASRHFSRSQAAMSEILARVEGRGLLTRIQDERDRRRTLMWLSEKGEQVLRDHSQVLSERRLVDAMGQLSVPQRQAVVDCLHALLQTTPTEEGWDDE